MLIKCSVVILPLLAGSLVYIGWRPKSLIMFSWFESMGVAGFIFQLREILSDYSLPNWVIFWLPNGTWTFAFTASLAFIWLNSNLRIKYLWLLIPLLLGIMMEIGQFWALLPGTFCWGDLLAHITGGVLALGITKIILNCKKGVKKCQQVKNV